MFTDRYEITYTSYDGQAHAAIIEHSPWKVFDKSTYRTNFDALFDYVRSHCTDVDTRPPKKLENKLLRRCRCEQLQLRYARDAPEKFVLVDFPANRTWWNTLSDSAFLACMCFFSFGVIVSVLVPGGLLLAAFLGIRVREGRFKMLR